jgi:glutamate---cysteine ligase / carboxylate-amine ligase
MDLRFGIEEEHFLVCDGSAQLKCTTDQRVFARASELLGKSSPERTGQIKQELLQSQIELATPVCQNFDQARWHLRHLRSCVLQAARESRCTILAAGTHPTAYWLDQKVTAKDRYVPVVRDLQMLAQRNLICGLHVHVEIDDADLRIAVMERIVPFLPLFLALSASSPFWQGRQTGFASYRMTSYREWPRTGLPPAFGNWKGYTEYVTALTSAGIIPDASYIWWAIRPSSKYDTLELRIADVTTDLEDALAIAALYRCLIRRLILNPYDIDCIPAHMTEYTTANLWNVQRHGLNAVLLNMSKGCHLISAHTAVRHLIRILRPDAYALDCVRELRRLECILREGSSAARQIDLFERHITGGHSRKDALGSVLRWLTELTRSGCPADNMELQVA